MKISGKLILKEDAGFEETIMQTLFNKCNPAQRPDIYTLPESVDDIIAIIRFAKDSNKKISVCSGGHSWSANHIRNNSILIDLSHFNKFEVNKEAMTAVAGPAVGGSCLLCALYKMDLFFPAGHCEGVCIGGYLLQGGFGWNSRKLGMACESVIGLDIVTTNGELVHANEKENADLFWAARGAGGGFFGVVVKFYLKLYPLPKYRGSITHVFTMKHLEDVFRWAYDAGPSISPAVEFQMLMSRRTLKYFVPGIEAIAPVFADTLDEFNDALSFMKDSPVRKKAYIRTPVLKPGMETMYHFAMMHYPDNHCWEVDNMWTRASIDDLLPHLKKIAETIPSHPSHLLWLNWYPSERKDMSFSMEDNIYIALYGAWKSEVDLKANGSWATAHMDSMAHLAKGIQLADENLHRRTSKFMSDEHLQKLESIRTKWDPEDFFNTWHSKPNLVG